VLRTLFVRSSYAKSAKKQQTKSGKINFKVRLRQEPDSNKERRAIRWPWFKAGEIYFGLRRRKLL